MSVCAVLTDPNKKNVRVDLRTLFSPVLYVRQLTLLPSLVHGHTTTRSEGWAVYPKEDRIFKLPTVLARVYLILL